MAVTEWARGLEYALCGKTPGAPGAVLRAPLPFDLPGNLVDINIE